MVLALLPVIGRPMVVEAEAEPTGNHTHGPKVGKCEEHTDWKEIGTADELLDLLHNGGKGYLVADIVIPKEYRTYISCSNKEDIDLCLNGYSVTMTSQRVDVYGKLNLYDEKENSGEIRKDEKVLWAPLFYVPNNGYFTMYGGRMTNTYSCSGGGVYVDGGTFIMSGGKLCDNYVEVGGGVYVQSGLFTMTGGEITNNTAEGGAGGVYVYKGTFTMTGGKITNNCYYGIIMEDGTFTMTGGIISDNQIYGNRDPIIIDGTFNFLGGYIFDSIRARKKNYSITFDANGGIGEMPTQYVSGNTNMLLTQNKYSNSGMRFVGWNTQPDGKGDFYEDESIVNIDGDLILYAQWIDTEVTNCYVVSFKVKNGLWEDGTKYDKRVTLCCDKSENNDIILYPHYFPAVGSKFYNG